MLLEPDVAAALAAPNAACALRKVYAAAAGTIVDVVFITNTISYPSVDTVVYVASSAVNTACNTLNSTSDALAAIELSAASAAARQLAVSAPPDARRQRRARRLDSSSSLTLTTPAAAADKGTSATSVGINIVVASTSAASKLVATLAVNGSLAALSASGTLGTTLATLYAALGTNVTISISTASVKVTTLSWTTTWWGWIYAYFLAHISGVIGGGVALIVIIFAFGYWRWYSSHHALKHDSRLAKRAAALGVHDSAVTKIHKIVLRAKVRRWFRSLVFAMRFTWVARDRERARLQKEADEEFFRATRSAADAAEAAAAVRGARREIEELEMNARRGAGSLDAAVRSTRALAESSGDEGDPGISHTRRFAQVLSARSSARSSHSGTRRFDGDLDRDASPAHAEIQISPPASPTASVVSGASPASDVARVTAIAGVDDSGASPAHSFASVAPPPDNTPPQGSRASGAPVSAIDEILRRSRALRVAASARGSARRPAAPADAVDIAALSLPGAALPNAPSPTASSVDYQLSPGARGVGLAHPSSRSPGANSDDAFDQEYAPNRVLPEPPSLGNAARAGGLRGTFFAPHQNSSAYAFEVNGAMPYAGGLGVGAPASGRGRNVPAKGGAAAMRSRESAITVARLYGAPLGSRAQSKPKGARTASAMSRAGASSLLSPQQERALARTDRDDYDFGDSP